MRYAVTHTTRYHYAGEVALSYHLARLAPRTNNGQQRDRFALRVTPEPAALSAHTDLFGNTVHYFEIHRAHTDLEVTATSLVTPADPRPVATGAWNEVRDALASPSDAASVEARQFCFGSPLIAADADAGAYARASFPEGRAFGEAVGDLCERLHRDIEFVPGVTDVNTPVRDVLARRRGVCQDIAQLMIACLRAVGLAARYVSGYIETDPPPGAEKLVGTDASHAWVSVRGPDGQWVDFDPTNNLSPAARHVTVAWGRDFSDVSPLQGVVHGGGGHRLTVSVDVHRV